MPIRHIVSIYIKNQPKLINDATPPMKPIGYPIHPIFLAGVQTLVWQAPR
jgi:hypothetical protein